jgi:hypothetical protein
MSRLEGSPKAHSRKSKFTRRVADCAAVLAAICLAIAFLANQAASSQRPPSNAATDSAQGVRLPGHVLPALDKATRVSPPRSTAAHEADQPLTLTIVLRRDRQADFERYLRGLYDPKSPIYRHFLSQDEIANRFGPTAQSYDAVERYLEAHGFHLIYGSKSRLTLTMSGTRADAEQAFGITICDYKLGKRQFFANDRDPALPAQIASSVQAIQGLSDLAEPSAVNKPIQAPPPNSPVFPPPSPKPSPTPGPPCSVEAASQCGANAGGSPCYNTKAAQQCYQQCLSNGGTPTNFNGQDFGGLLDQLVTTDCGPADRGADKGQLRWHRPDGRIGRVRFVCSERRHKLSRIARLAADARQQHLESGRQWRHDDQREPGRGARRYQRGPHHGARREDRGLRFAFFGTRQFPAGVDEDD